MLENARLLGDRHLAEEALKQNLSSCQFIRRYFMKTSFDKNDGLYFSKILILKLPKLVACPSLRLRHRLMGERRADGVINKPEASVEQVPPFSVFQPQQPLW
jgi:hypothetical protein